MISLEQVVVKMAGEIGEAQEADDQAKIKEHVRAIRLLADLILDQQPEKAVQPDISEQELRQMMGSKVESKPKPTGDYGQSTSDSLLDF